MTSGRVHQLWRLFLAICLMSMHQCHGEECGNRREGPAAIYIYSKSPPQNDEACACKCPEPATEPAPEPEPEPAPEPAPPHKPHKHKPHVKHHHPKPKCPHGFRLCGYICYKFLHKYVHHPQAVQMCKKLGKQVHLATPRTKRENTCVSSIVRGDRAWLGFTDSKKEGVFVGMDGKGTLRPGQARWGQHPKEPDDFKHKEDCVEWFGKKNWNDQECGHRVDRPLCQSPRLH